MKYFSFICTHADLNAALIAEEQSSRAKAISLVKRLPWHANLQDRASWQIRFI